MWSRRLGPRVRFGMTGALSRNQAVIAVLGAFTSLWILHQSTPWSLLLAIMVGGGFAVLTVAKYKGMPMADWAIKAAAYWTGRKAWQARPVGEVAEQLPRELAGVRIVSVRDRNRTVGMLEERRTLTAVARLEVHSLGLFDESEQTRRMDAFKRILDDLARSTDDRYRVALLSKHVPRRANEELAYIHAHVVDPESPQAKSMLEVVSDTQGASHEDEMYVCMRLSRGNGTPTAAKLIDLLDELIDKLAHADIVVKTAGRLLAPREVARLVKDSFDPFGRDVRDRLEQVTGTAGLDPAAAWPDATYRHVDCYETDGALHATYWMRGWPQTSVSAGWMRPLTLRCEVPAMTITTVLKPEVPAKALAMVRKKRVRGRGASMFRQRHGQDETVEQGTKQEFLHRQEHQMAAEGASPWFWETYVTVSAPDERTLEASAHRVESACVECALMPVALRFAQAEAFTFSLPLGRGLEPENSRI